MDDVPRNASKLIALALAFQVGLVGALGTGLHSLFGCSHGVKQAGAGNASAGCCNSATCSCKHGSAFSRRREARRQANHAAASRGESVLTSASTQGGCSGDCSICELLKQYQSVARYEPARLPVSTAIFLREAEIVRVHANETTRLAESRGPPRLALS